MVDVAIVGVATAVHYTYIYMLYLRILFDMLAIVRRLFPVLGMFKSFVAPSCAECCSYFGAPLRF